MYQLIKNKMMESPNDYLSIKFKTNLINKFLGLKILFSKWKFSQKWGGKVRISFYSKVRKLKKKTNRKENNFILSIKFYKFSNMQMKRIL